MPTTPNASEPASRAVSRNTPLPRTDGDERALPFGGLERRIELPHLKKSDDRARRIERDDVRERAAGGAVARRGFDQLLNGEIGDGLVETKA